MKKWKTVSNFQIPIFNFQINKLTKVLLENRGVKTKKEIEEFLKPKLEDLNVKNAKIDKKQLDKAVRRIFQAVKNEEQIVIYGDYDVDGICATAILWETLHTMGAKVSPYIPHRIDEGYGLSLTGISNIKDQKSKTKDTTLIITVDNGIVASEAVEFANKNGIDVIITDHHVKPQKLPDAYAIVHTTNLCGTGVAYLFAQDSRNVILERSDRISLGDPISLAKRGFQDDSHNSHLELVALATIADMVPLLGLNRTLTKFGLDALRKTKRVGLLELFKEAALDQSTIGVYEVGHIIAPRLNAMGRLEYAMDSLRLLCTKNKEKAYHLAQLLGQTNKERQELTNETAEHAKDIIQKSKVKSQNLLFISHETYQQGVIGLVAGKLVEEFYRPSIVVSIGEKYSKASARSISGFNIIEFIRSASEHLIDCGGHPMAAGFTVETEKITILKEILEKKAAEILSEEKLKRVLKIDCEIPLSIITGNLYREIQKLAPFGMGNPEPTFLSKRVEIEDMRLVGNEGKHVKFKFGIQKNRHAEFISASQEIPKQVRDDRIIEGIGFGLGEKSSEFHIGDKVDIVYTIDENDWLARRNFNEGGNGNRNLQLKTKDIKSS